ncbi:MAG: LacI family DNA-binding transcriptional regulator [Actinomycetota bacterium]
MIASFSENVFGAGSGVIATIRELAEQLGVSVATVSRVLNGYPDVAPDTRERVLAAIRESDFTPVRAARSLVTGRTHVIGVILATGDGHPDLQHPFFQEVLVGLKHRAGGMGFDLLLFSVGSTGNGSGGGASHRYLARARQHRVDGVVVMGVDRHDPDVEELVSSGIPMMAVDLDLEGGRTGHVTSDNVAGASLAVRHLAELGHRRIALIGGAGDTRPGVERLLGYRRELERLGLEHRPEYVREGDFYPESGHVATGELLDLPEPPTAIFAAADLMAAGAIQAITERDRSVPRDVAVVGFDDIHIAALLQPSLTTVRQNKQGLGAAAAVSLIGMIEDPELDPPVVVVPVELVIRDSSVPVVGASSGSREGGGPWTADGAFAGTSE